MQFISIQQLRRALCATIFAAIGLMAAAQNEHVKLAPPGDSLETPGPLATGLSPKLSRPELAKAMKIVADWQLGHLPAQAQYDWTFAALYAGYMGVPDAVAGDKYKQAMMEIAEKLQWSVFARCRVAR